MPMAKEGVSELLQFAMNVPRSTAKNKETVSQISSNECQAMIKTMQDLGGQILEKSN